MSKKKIGKLSNERVPKQEPIVIVFGSQRIGAIYCLRNEVDPRRVFLASAGADSLRNYTAATITVVRVSKEVWSPPTHPCEVRTRETEQALKALEATGTTINTVRLD